MPNYSQQIIVNMRFNFIKVNVFFSQAWHNQLTASITFYQVAVLLEAFFWHFVLPEVSRLSIRLCMLIFLRVQYKYEFQTEVQRNHHPKMLTRVSAVVNA